MKLHLKIFTTTILFTSLLTMACHSEATRQESVTSKTNSETTTAPPANQVEGRDHALVRTVYAIPNSAPADIFADENKEFMNIAYKSVTPYKELKAERFTFSVRPAGQQTATPLAENSEGLYSGNHYTVIAMPGSKDDSPSLHVLSDNLTPPAEGKAKIRVVHASPDTGEVNVYLQGKNDALFTGVDFQTETNYTEVDPLTATLQVRSTDNKTTVLTVPNISFEPGKIYTIVVLGRAKAQPRLEALTIEDRLIS